jgi:carbonic anhydrase
MMTENTQTPLSRRRALSLFSLAAAAAVLPAPLRGDALPEVGTPEEALQELLAGNRRFVEGRPVGPHRGMARVRDVAAAQNPFAAILSCADSRVPVEIVFDQGFGDLFVCRAAGNVVTPEIIGSLEFGTLVLGSKVLVVLGHTGCGAVKAAIAGDPVPGQISTLFRHIQPAVARTPTREQEAVARENVREQVRLLRTASPVVAGLIRERKLDVVGGIYDLATGRVTMLPA